MPKAALVSRWGASLSFKCVGTTQRRVDERSVRALRCSVLKFRGGRVAEGRPSLVAHPQALYGPPIAIMGKETGVIGLVSRKGADMMQMTGQKGVEGGGTPLARFFECGVAGLETIRLDLFQ